MGKISALILAAGKGKRMESDFNKQFLQLKGKPILYYTLKVFSENKNIDEIILVAAKDEIEYCRQNIVDKYGFFKIAAIVEGGKERQDSVYNGLNSLSDCEIVLIHDGARPFVNNRIIEEGIKYARDYGATTCGVCPKDTIKIRDKENFTEATLQRSSLFSVQTPQSFCYDLIWKCHKKRKRDNLDVTDDTMVLEAYGHKVYLYEGSYDNIKITTPEDLFLGDKILENLEFDY